jgi:hypothetical protein
MSSKIAITPTEIEAAIKALPPGPQAKGGNDAVASALALMAARPAPASQVRVILYRYDDGESASADTFQAQMQAGDLPLHGIAQVLDCDLQLIELGAGAYDAAEAARACAFGMMAAEQSTGLLVVTAFGAGSEARTSDKDQFFDTASPEVAALMGAFVAAARAGIPVISEAPQGQAALDALRTLRPDLASHVYVCEPGETPLEAALIFAMHLQNEFEASKAA